MKAIQHGGTRARRGSALALSLAVVSVIALLSAMMLQLSSSYWKREAAAVDAKRAFYIAEAGLAEAIHGILQGNSGLVGSEDLPARFGEGVFWTDVLADAHGILHIDSTALCGQARSKLSIAIEVTSASSFGLGAFGDGQVVVGAGSYIDIYDSRKGPYAPPEEGALVLDGGQVGSNGDITLEAARGVDPLVIYGNVVPGKDASVIQGVGTIVMGETTPRKDHQELDPIQLPDVRPTGAIVQLVGNGTVEPGTYGTTSLLVGPAATTTIQGPAVLVVDDLTISALGQLRIDSTDGPVEIYVKNSINAMALSKITNVTQDPRGFQLFIEPAGRGNVLGSPVQLNHDGDFHGSIYAPNARIDMNAGTSFYGSVVAKQLHIGRNSQLHLDQSAGAVGVTDMSIDLLSWRQVAAPKEYTTDLRYDPVRDFAERGVALPTPAEAHEEIEVAVEFQDANGQQYVYRGPDSRRPNLIDEVLREVDAAITPPLARLGTLRQWQDIDDEDAGLLSMLGLRRR